ncbi:MAG TPA: hypothetical protein VIZ28_20355 [Chitinophagaceae bacterium]
MKKVFPFLIVFLVLSSCSPNVKVTNSWKNVEVLSSSQKKYTSIFISAFTANMNAKVTVETALAKAAQSKGYKAVRSIDLFPGDISGKNVPDKDLVLRKIKQLGCDAIFTVAVVDEQSETRYVQGSFGVGIAYNPYAMYGHYGTYGHYNNYWYNSAMYTTPGYYSTDKTYFLESNLFDAETEKILWSAQSKAVNPKNLETFTEKYTYEIVKKIEYDDLMNKKKK